MGLGWAGGRAGLGSDVQDDRAREVLKGCLSGYHGTGSMTIGALKRLNDTGAHFAPDHVSREDMPADPFLNQINLNVSERSITLASAVYDSRVDEGRRRDFHHPAYIGQVSGLPNTCAPY